MLKIKDDVDLKELEKFGFKVSKTKISKYLKHTYITYYKEIKVGTNYSHLAEIISILPNREIKINFYKELAYIICELLYDLIKADLVEKVKE